MGNLTKSSSFKCFSHFLNSYIALIACDAHRIADDRLSRAEHRHVGNTAAYIDHHDAQGGGHVNLSP